jgi:hypothetical protein
MCYMPEYEAKDKSTKAAVSSDPPGTFSDPIRYNSTGFHYETTDK